MTVSTAEQGLADTFILLGMPFDSAEAKQLNKEIFETIYFAALEKSCSLAKTDGVPYTLYLFICIFSQRAIHDSIAALAHACCTAN